MATSNKILLGLFLLPVVILVSIYGSLYARYKQGDYVTEKQQNEASMTINELPAFSGIDLGEYKGGDITVKTGDAFSLSYYKNDKEGFQFEVRDNTLFVKTLTDNYQQATITCPSFSHIRVEDTRLHIGSMILGRCTFDIRGQKSRVNFAARVDTLSLDLKDRSSVHFNEEAVVGVLNLTMENNTKLSGNHAVIKSFGQVAVADSAAVNLDGRTLMRLVPITNQ
ncbi:MAG: hypothetical protein KIT80_21880 [Chitinophagaceae bacterium]|nr:hypothetical protein [Chitinophagaceae bacterium]MCW5929586.1 hypothetical protein [Chitinophagaceae bacterium]